MPRSDLSTGVLLLAHRRLKSLEQLLRTKENLVDVEIDTAHNRGPVPHGQIEKRLRAQIAATLAMLEYGDRIPPPSTDLLGFGIGRAAITGTMGTTLVDIAARTTPGYEWYRHALHRGSTDPNVSRVDVRSTEFVLDVAARALRLATTEPDKVKIRALILGMLSDVATHVVVGPVLRGAATDRTFADIDLHSALVGVDAGTLTAQRLLGGRNGRSWREWWLPTADVPTAFFQGYAEALAALESVTTPLGFASTLAATTRTTGMTADQLTTAYRLFLDGLENPFSTPNPGTPAVGANLSLLEWWGVMIGMFLPPSLALLCSQGTSKSKRLWEPASATPPPDGSSWLELALWGGFWGSLPAIVYPFLMMSGYPHDKYPFALAGIWGGWRLLMTLLGIFSTSDAEGKRVTLILTFLPDLVSLIAMIVELIRGNTSPALLHMIQLIAAITIGLTMVAGAAFRGAGVTWGWGSFFPAWLIVFLVGLGFSFAAGAILKAMGGFRLAVIPPSSTNGVNREPALIGNLPNQANVVEPRGTAMVFDDASLWALFGRPTTTRGDFAYPAGSRTLLKLTWAGRFPLQLKVEGPKLTFRIDADPDIVVNVPPGTTAATLATLLTTTVLDNGEAKLTVVQASATEQQPTLPFRFPVADAGDTVDDGSHDTRRTGFTIISANAEHPTLLRQAPRAHHAIRFGTVGPARTDLEGWKVVPSELLGDADATAMGNAAELAALLFLAATPELSAAPISADGGDLRPGYEVFRRWNLDERAANEWRTLIAGGARSERTSTGDPLRRSAPVGATVIDDPGGRALLERMGWLPTFRAWTRVATDPTQDTGAPRAAPYSPPDGPPGTTTAPTNDLLSRAVRVLLNL